MDTSIMRLAEGSSLMSSSLSALSPDGLMDVFMAVWYDLNRGNLAKTPSVAQFLNKYRQVAEKIQNCRPQSSDFELKEVIGRGNFGDVRLVQSYSDRKCFAMKTMLKHSVVTKSDVTFFQEERDIMVQSDSNWIAKLHHSFFDATNLYLVMDFYPGGDLQSLLARNDHEFSENWAKFYMAETLEAIHSLHQLGYAHRDIKPENILIDRWGHIKLADFGSAAKISSEGWVTNPMPVGTPDYISPEILCCTTQDLKLPNVRKSQTNSHYGPECDFWSLGVVGYELLYGVTPFAADSLLETYNKILNHERTLMFPENSDVSTSAINLIGNLLQERATRSRYEAAKTHEFFKGVDWTNLTSMMPPFVPNISKPDDSKYFSTFSPKIPSLTGHDNSFLKGGSGFSGENLRFVGFSFSRDGKRTFDLTTSSAVMELLKKKESECRVANEKLFEAELECEKLRNDLMKESFRCNKVELETSQLKEKCSALEKQLAEKPNKSGQGVELNIYSTTAEAVKAVFEKQKAAFEAEREAFRQQISDTELAVSHYQQRMESAAHRADVYEGDLAKQRLKNKELVGIVDKLKEQVKKAKNSAVQATSKYNDIEAELKRFHVTHEANLAELKRIIQQKSDQLVERQNDESRADQSVMQLKESLSKLESELETNRAEISRLKTDLIYRDAELESLRTRLRETPVSVVVNDRRKVDSREDQLVEQIKRLMNQLEAIKIQQPSDRQYSCDHNDLHQELGSLKTVKNYLEAQLEELKSTKESMANELLKAQEEILELKEEVVQMKKLMDDKDNTEHVTYMHLLDENSKIKQQKAELRFKFREAERELSVIKERNDSETTRMLNETNSDLQAQLTTQSEKADQLKLALDSAESTIAEYRINETFLKEQISGLEKKVVILEQRVADASLGSDEYRNSMEKKVTELTSTANTLQEALAELDNQLVDTDRLKESYKERNREFALKCEELKAEVTRYRQLGDTTKLELEREMRERKHLEAKCAAMQEELEATHIDYRSEVTSAVASLSTERQQLVDKLSRTESKCARLEGENLALKGNLKKIELDKQCDQGEMVALEAKLNEEKEAQFRLKQGLSDAVDKIERYKAERDDLSVELEKSRLSFTTKLNGLMLEEKKIQETINQQNKLIAYLQEQMATPRRKGGISGFLTGNNKGAEGQNTYVKDLQDMLAAERKSNGELRVNIKRLQNQLREEQSRSYVSRNGQVGVDGESSMMSIMKKGASAHDISCDDTTTSVISSSATAPGIGDSNGFGRVMRHNIPHKWKGHFNMKFVQCAACLEGLPFLRHVFKCQDCHILVHPRCTDSLLNTCGLPMVYNEMYQQNFEHRPISNPSHSPAGEGRMTGWIRYLRPADPTAVWQDVWADLNKGILRFYSSEDITSQPLDVLDFSSEAWRLRFRPYIEGNGANSITKQDLPYMLQVTAEKKSVNCIYMMAPTLEAKQRWVEAFRVVTTQRAAMQRRRSTLNVSSTLMMCFDGSKKLSVNCGVLYAGQLLLGCAEGLYFASMKDPHADPHLLCDSVVYLMEIIPEVSTLVLVMGEDRHLVFILLSQLDFCFKDPRELPNLTPISDLMLIHQISQGTLSSNKGERFLFLADPDQIHILQFNTRLQIFTVLKQIATVVPASCLLFISDFLLVGVDKFQQISLPSCKISDFLNVEDVSLASMVSGAVKDKDYPMTAVDISITDDKVELLLCFQTFGVFTDDKGRRTRIGEVEWPRAIQEITFTSPYLFVTHFDSVEIMEIQPLSATGDLYPKSLQLIELSHPRFVGMGLNDGDLLISCTKANSCEILCINAVSTLGLRKTSSREKRKRLVSFMEESKRNRQQSK